MYYDLADAIADPESLGERHLIRDIVVLVSVFGAAFAAFGLACLIR